MGNAYKYCDEKSSVELIIDVVENRPFSQKLIFKVKDNGNGFDQNVAEGLFEEFAQAESGMNRSKGGMGLGLAICQNIIQLMNGRIGVESELGVGSTFWFELDLRKSMKKEEPEEKLDFNYKNQRILIVEDNKFNQKILSRILKSGQHEVTLCDNGLEATEIVEKQKFDLIYMDLQMPVMDGIQSSRIILTKHKIPIIACTANYQSGEEETCLGLGMKSFVKKPIIKKDLIKSFNTVMENVYKPSGRAV